MDNRVDDRLAAAFRDVPIPPGLAQRLLDRLAVERNTEQIAPDDILQLTYSTHLSSRFSRRWLLVGGGLLTVAASLLIAVWLGAGQTDGLSEQFVLDEAIRAFDVVIAPRGQLVSERLPPAGYPFSSAVLQARGTSWRPLDEFLGRRGVVYELLGRAGARAALYVVAADDTPWCGDAPAVRPFTTGGYCASAWQEGGLLYVLVVQGDPATYNGYLNLPSEPVA